MKKWKYRCFCGNQAKYLKHTALEGVGDVCFVCSCGETFRAKQHDPKIIKKQLCGLCGGELERTTAHEMEDVMLYILNSTTMNEAEKEMMVCSCGAINCVS